MWELEIPEDKQTEALKAAKVANCRLLFDPESNSWLVSGRELPTSLKQFEVTKTVKTWCLDVPFTERQRVSALGGRWASKEKVTTYTGTFLPPELEAYLPLAYTWEEKKALEITNSCIAPRKATGNIVLHAHQVTAKNAIVAAIRARRAGFILADEVGLGKTYATLAGILEGLKTPSKILIVAPLAVLPVWRNALFELGDNGHDILILNYHKLNKLFNLDAGKKVKSLKGLAKSGKSDKYNVIVWDESHYLKSMVSDNPAARAKLAQKLYKNTEFLIWLSATAGQNLLEVGYLHPILQGGSFKSITEWAAEEGFNLTRGEYGKWLWDPSPDEEKKLSNILFNKGNGLRRLPQAVAGWPEINRILHPIEMSPQEKKTYQLAWAEFLKAMQIDRAAGRISTNGLTATLRLRQKASILKVPHTLELLESLLDSGRKVPISFEFLDSLQAVADELTKRKISFGTITGKSEKERERLLFQQGSAQVVLFTVKEGISLHEGEYMIKDKPRAQIVHDLRWSGIDQHQIDGRSHRNGKFCPIYWMILEGTIEEKVAKALLTRMQGMAGIHGETKEILLDLWDQLKL